MRIAVLTNSYPPAAVGGAAIIARNYSRELENREHEVKVFVSPAQLVGRPVWKRLMIHLRDLRADDKLAREILEWRPQVLLSHNLTGCGFGTPRQIQKHGVRWIHVLHDVQLVEPSGQIVSGCHPDESARKDPSDSDRQTVPSPSLRMTFPELIWRWMWSRLRRRILGHPDAVVSPTQWLLDFHREWGFFGGMRTQVIPNPVVSQSLRGGSNKTVGDAAISGGESEIASSLAMTERGRGGLLFVGRVDHDKGIDLLLAAWRALGDERPQLTIVGDGERRAALELQSDSRLTVMGPQPHERIGELMSAATTVVVPSLVLENQPTVILEALGVGCRVIASDVGGISETLDGAGWIFAAGDVASLSRALRAAMANEGDASVREAARQKVLQRHLAAVAVAVLESLF